MNLQKIVKRKFNEFDFATLLHSLVWMSPYSCLYFFTSMCRLGSMFWICVTCFSDEFEIVNGSRLLFYDLSKKGVPWKFWLDSRFLRNPKRKWTLKWLPLDRGYFKFYFHKGKSLLIIPCHMHLSTRNFVVLLQVMFALPCTSFWFNCHVMRYY